ncbi:MAG: ABC transporter permease [Gemmatimonadaceae bacterium]|nr:ABC transporter permease [Gemmatimonadaceae bacterium]
MIDDPPRMWRRLRVLFNWRRHNAELAEEMAHHLDSKRRHFESQGLAPDAALAAAHRAMGNTTAVRESSRDVWMSAWIESVWQDVVYAMRSLRRHPLFAVVAILGLSGGLGFAAAAFTGVNAFLLKGWDVREPERLVALFATSLGEPNDRRKSGFTLDQVRMFAAEAQTLDAVFTHERRRADGSGSVTAAPVSANYFTALGVPLIRGRAFTSDEDRIGASAQVIVLSHRYWRDRLAAAPGVLDTTVRVQGVAFTVIGIAAEGFEGTDLVGVDGWIPMASMPLVHPRDNMSTGALAHSDQCCVQVAARMAPDVTREQVNAELTTLLARTMRPGVDTLVRRVTAQPFTMVGSAGPNVTREVVPVFLLIGGGVSVVLLLACANVANLLLARASARQREITIRLALGASRARVVRQLMTESLMLALLAGVPAMIVARWAPQWVLTTLTDQAHALQFTPDWRVVLFTFGLAVASCVLFGLAPALHATKPLVAQRRRVALRSIFLSAQVTFSLVLLVAAGLFVRSARAERALHLGFATDDVVELTVQIPANEEPSARGALLRAELADAVASTGVQRVAYALTAPFNPEGRRFALPGGPTAVAPVVYASASYFDVLSLRMAAGRVYRDAPENSEREVVVNAPLAAQFGGALKAVGASLLIDSVPFTIVGVVHTTRDVGLRDVRPALYLPFAWDASPRVIVRGDAAGAQRLVRYIAARDPSLTVSLRSYQWYVDQRFSQTNFSAAVSGALGLLALTLATIGMLGVFSYWVEQRQHDISVRFALGATSAHIVRMVATSSARAVAWGLGIGIVGAVGVARLLRSSLYGLQPVDLPAFGAAIGILVAAAIVATLLPTRRALKIDPMTSLRGDG